MQNAIELKLRSALLKKWEALTYENNIPVYFYVISQGNVGWGVVIPEMLGVIKHSKDQNYRVCFIANPGTNIETLRLFENISNFELWERWQFIHVAEIETYNSQLGLSVGRSDQLRHLCINNSNFNNLFSKIPDFNWPFSDLLRCIIHNTEFVHPDFVLNPQKV